MKRYLLGFVVLVACLAQSTSPPVAQPTTPPAAISVYYRLTGQSAAPYPYKWGILDYPLILTVDSAGSPHIGLDPDFVNSAWLRPADSPQLSDNPKLALVTMTGAGGQILLNTASFAFRGTPPAQSGACTVSAGVWASDSQFFYFCTQDPANAKGLIWARLPLQTTW